MSQTYPASDEFIANAHVNAAQYEEMYAASISDPDAFLGRAWQTHRLDSSRSPK